MSTPTSSSSSLNLPLMLYTFPFSHGDPGSMYSVFAPTFPSHSRTASAVNSGPLSDLMCSGTPLGCQQRCQRLDYVWGTDAALCPDGQALPGVLLDEGQQPHRPAVPGPDLNKVIGPHMVLISGLSLTQDPSFSHSRPLPGCLAGTFSPSRRQILSTRLWFTFQPASLSIAVIRR